MRAGPRSLLFYPDVAVMLGLAVLDRSSDRTEGREWATDMRESRRCSLKAASTFETADVAQGGTVAGVL